MKKEQLDLSELIAIGVGGMIDGVIYAIVLLPNLVWFRFLRRNHG